VKKVIIGSAIIASCLFGEVISILPYVGSVTYDENKTKSGKDTGTLKGVHASIGSLSYLIEIDYAEFAGKFKDITYIDLAGESQKITIEDLDQKDFAFAYSKYFRNSMFKIGKHTIDTTDPLLKDGDIIFVEIGGYNFIGYDKYSYGVEGYYSKYSDGQDELNVRKSIAVTQITPYINIYDNITYNLKNFISLKYNYQKADDYVEDSYSSYEISDSIYYKSFFTTLKYYNGKMKTGVKDGGFTVMNTLDLMKDGYDVKIGYYISAGAIMTISYGENNYQEFDTTTASLLDDGTNSVAVATFNYSF
jgi:hypothetical protein